MAGTVGGRGMGDETGTSEAICRPLAREVDVECPPGAAARYGHAHGVGRRDGQSGDVPPRTRTRRRAGLGTCSDLGRWSVHPAGEWRRSWAWTSA